MDHAFKTLFSTIALCISFAVVLVTLGAVGIGGLYVINELLPRHINQELAYVVFVIFFFVALAMAKGLFHRIAVASSLRQDVQLDKEESRIMQEIYQGLSKMERRIEALETILLDTRAGHITGL